jgi:hypothetical protein
LLPRKLILIFEKKDVDYGSDLQTDRRYPHLLQ